MADPIFDEILRHVKELRDIVDDGFDRVEKGQAKTDTELEQVKRRLKKLEDKMNQ